MTGLTPYNLVDGEFFLRQMPIPDEQIVKQTIQGVIDEFIFKSDEISMQSMLAQNERVKITENVFQAESFSVINKSQTAHATDSSSNPFNRIVTHSGAGSANVGGEYTASTSDEIVAIAVNDVRPFLLKGLSYEHRAGLVDDQPTNDNYIRHLTPLDAPRVASIKSPSILVNAGGPQRVLVFYDAVDLTGEVVAGTGLPQSDFNAEMSSYHASGDKAYLVVKKTIPSSATVYRTAGDNDDRSLSDLLRRPYELSSVPSTASDVELEVTAAGGIVLLPTADFKRNIGSHALQSFGSEGTMPSPFINIEHCLLSIKNSKIGYGRPQPVINTNTPDPIINPSHHVLTIMPSTGNSIVGYDESTQKSSALSRSSFQVFNVIDNIIKNNQSMVLIQPANLNRFAGLDDFLTLSNSTDPMLLTIEIALLNGRAEEFNVNFGQEGSELEIRGRSNLMDLVDSEVERDLEMGSGSPLKEIGDLGTPTVALTLGGLGQGGIDSKPLWDQHENLIGWKDRISSANNPSIRNDKQTSTHYASTRALVELPLFPSMFYDVDKIHSDEKEKAHPNRKSVQLEIDCTMTAMNRVQMKSYEGRSAIDWGMEARPAIIVNRRDMPQASNDFFTHNPSSNDPSFAIRCQNPKIQAVVTGFNLTLGTANSYITVDSVDPFLNDAHIASASTEFYITVGEGVVYNSDIIKTLSHPLPIETRSHFYMFKVHTIDAVNEKLFVSEAFMRYPQGEESYNLSASSPRADERIFAGATVMLGGVIVNSQTSTVGPSYDDFDITSIRNAICTCLGESTSNANILYYPGTTEAGRIIFDNQIMDFEAFEFDIYNEYGFDNDRILEEPIVCRPSYLALKGIESDTLQWVLPQIINLRDIANKSSGFQGCVDELIRQINMAGHASAIASDGSSAFKTELRGGKGSHLGYVRAFRGDSVESRTGERGASIVIHSTVPGATGRNFAVWIHNDSAYPYVPQQAFGFGGLLATNSRNYKTNSFPAPLPIGSDGQTFVPLTSFTGAPHGSTIHPSDSTNSLRSYEGVGSRFIVKTKASTIGVGSGTGNIYGTQNAVTGVIDFIAVEAVALDYFQRSICGYSQTLDGDAVAEGQTTTQTGILTVGGKKATFSTISTRNATGSSEKGVVFIKDITPLKDPEQFYNALIDTSATPATESAGIEVEFIYPLMDSSGIIFFGGGHTGVVLDISDGTNQDYSNKYTHPLSNGPTGFSGFQNIGEVTTSSAVLDFSKLTNLDTLNDNTFRGIHHRTRLDSNNSPSGNCAFYSRFIGDSVPGKFVDDIIGLQSTNGWVDDLYEAPLAITSYRTLIKNQPITTGGLARTDLETYPTYNTEIFPTPPHQSYAANTYPQKTRYLRSGGQGGGVESVVTLVGSGYSTGTGLATNAISGSGSSLTVKINQVDGSGGIVHLEVDSFGSGYAVNDVIEVTGGGGSGARFTLTSTGTLPKADTNALFRMRSTGGSTFVVDELFSEVKSLNPLTLAGWTIGAAMMPNQGGIEYGRLDHFTGPVFHGIHDDGTPNGKPYGLHVSGSPAVGGSQSISVAITTPQPAFFPVGVSALVSTLTASGDVRVKSNGWTYVLAGKNSTGGCFCYIGNTVGITDPTDAGGAFVAGMFDFTPYLITLQDEHYGTLGVSPNKKNTFETKTSGYAGGDADHPSLEQLHLGVTSTVRDVGMAVIGNALIGAPFIDISPGAMTQGGLAAPVFNGYFTGLQTGAATYGDVNYVASTGTNSAGPICFHGFLCEVSLWKRTLTFAEAGELFAGFTTW